MQFALHAPIGRIPHGQAIYSARGTRQAHTYTCSHRFRPTTRLQYEHMFCSYDAPPFAQRLFDGLCLIRSFLLLEDDYGRDWEVAGREPIESPVPVSGMSGKQMPAEGRPARGRHPHRVALQSRLGSRRPGVAMPLEQVCLCPVGGRARAGVSHGSYPSERSCVDHTRN
jgi:hypothetical protein